MAKRANGSGTLYRRNGWYYAQMKVQGRMTRIALKTRDRAQATASLNRLSAGYDLSDEERLAALAVRLRPRTEATALDEAWRRYTAHPCNAAQTDGARRTDEGRWRFFTRWLYGYDGGARCRVNRPAAHPEVDAIGDVDEAIAAEFIAYAKTNTAPETINKYLRILRKVWELNDAPKNPWRSFKRFKTDPVLRRPLTEEEMDEVIGRADGELKAIMLCSRYTGLRLQDCAQLTSDNVDWQSGVIFRRTNKTKRTAGIAIHPRLAKVLPHRAHGALFPIHAAMPEWRLSDEVQAHFAECGLCEREKPSGYRRRVATVGFHSFRIGFITALARAGVPLPVVRDMVGHVNEAMTMHYFRANSRMVKDAIAKLD